MHTKRSNPKRKHHELPELYLRGFCDGSFLWIYERGKPYNPGIKKHKFNPYRCGVVEIAEKDRYARVMPDGTRDFDSYENRLERIEKTADDILRKIRSQSPITSNEKEIFAAYIQNLYKRTKERERKTRGILDETQKGSQLNNIALLFALNGQFGTARKYYDAQKYLESDDGKKTLILESMVTPYPTLHQTIKSMSWTFCVAAGDSYFVTSSAPVAFDPVGLFVSPLLFPISKNTALIATHDEGTDLEFRNTSSDETLMINFYTIVNAPSVYAHKPESWVWEILEHGLALTENQSLALKKLLPFRTGG
jgi:hypothetical protein